MINGKRVLAYIPARSGSKGIPHKNITKINGQPLIAYSIKAAQQSQYVDQVILSTDSEEYAMIGKEYGVKVPFIRPIELAQDNTPEIEVVLHLMNWLEENNSSFDIIIKLQPTSPLRTSKDIDQALTLLMDKRTNSIVSVCECSVSPLWTNTLPTDLSMKNFIREEIKTANRQKLPTYYQLNGAIFISDWAGVKNRRSWFGENSYAYLMPKERSLDVDDPFDLKMIDFLLQNNEKQNPEDEKK